MTIRVSTASTFREKKLAFRYTFTVLLLYSLYTLQPMHATLLQCYEIKQNRKYDHDVIVTSNQ